MKKLLFRLNIYKSIYKNNDLTWYTALHNVKGIYVIVDTSNGKQYVGSVYGEFAFWTRWKFYCETGHGGNFELKRIIVENGIEYAFNFQFSILEIRSTLTSDHEILAREQYWKKVLLTNEYGYNRN